MAEDMNERERRIRERAHQLWEQAGRPEGEDERFWREAEAQIDEQDRLTEVPRVTLDEVRDPHFTNGLSVSEYLNRLREGTLGEQD